MTELSKQILEVIKSHNGIKAVEIAQILDCDKTKVNSALYSASELRGLCRQDSKYRWYSNEKEILTSTVSEDIADKTLNNICKYYLECLNGEGKMNVETFLTSKYELPYVEVNGLNKDNLLNENVSEYLKKHNVMKKSVNYIGYPICVEKFTSKAGEVYYKEIPVFLFNIQYEAGAIEIDTIPMLNTTILKKYCGNDVNMILYEQRDLEKDLGLDDESYDIEIDELVMRLQSIRAWEWKEEINPNNINIDVPIQEITDTGIYNRALVISTEKSPYTIGLESELIALSKKSTEDIRDTALYNWLNYSETLGKESLSSNASEDSNILEVLPLNSEQFQAVNMALNNKLTIVTGPPGTGKSQVVTNIIINMAYRGKNVLFSSKNNKAVDVVYKRVNGLSKKPIMIHVGGINFAGELAGLVEDMLAAYSYDDSLENLNNFRNAYDGLIQKKKNLVNKKNRLIEKRNRLDQLEKRVSSLDSDTRKMYFEMNSNEVSEIKNQYNQYKYFYQKADKNKQDFFTKLFWRWNENERAENLFKCAEALNNKLEKYDVNLFNRVINDEEFKQQNLKVSQLICNMSNMVEYSEKLKELESNKSLEDYDLEIFNLNKELHLIAIDLWAEWMNNRNNNISHTDRMQMISYVSAMKLAGDDNFGEHLEIKNKFKKLQAAMARYLPCWAVTSLSAKGNVPLEKGIFDLLVIDEASQCDIASILPLLYRAKRAVIIGDRKQLGHISSISKTFDESLVSKFGVDFRWSYSSASLYDLAQGMVNTDNIVALRDHHRSFEDIIDFSNEEFYDGRLRVTTNYSKLVVPEKDQPGIRWNNVIGEVVSLTSGSCYNLNEAEAVVDEIRHLVENNYKGSVGVVTPFRAQAEKIRKIIEQDKNLYENLAYRNQTESLIVDTVHKFQGDERDLILFSTVISKNSKQSHIRFLENTGNLFNVAITRARAILVVVGDVTYCSQCNVGYMERFVKYYQSLKNKLDSKKYVTNYGIDREYPCVSNIEQVSEWEKIFYTALFDVGIKTIPQYPEDKYKLDLAIIKGDKKLDIEIDGEMYHKDWNGELCYKDQLRNQRLFELGWDVKRFWVYQIRDEIKLCIEEIKRWTEEN